MICCCISTPDYSSLQSQIAAVPAMRRSAAKTIASTEDLDKIYRCLPIWLARQKSTDAKTRIGFVDALMAISKERFGNGTEADWAKLAQTFRQMRKAMQSRSAEENQQALSELNPF